MKTALITGASQGIGRAVATKFAAEGYEVALLARSEDKLLALASEIESAGGKAIALPCDVTDHKAVLNAVDSLRVKWSELSVLFNNAGANKPGSVEIAPEDFRHVHEVNVFGAFNVLHAVVPWMKEAGAGTIINLASIAGITGFPGVGAYCSSKFALRGLNESLHHELEPLGIRVAAISPSWVDTEMAGHCPHPKEKMIHPNDIADTALYISGLSSNVSLKEIVVGCREDLRSS